VLRAHALVLRLNLDDEHLAVAVVDRELADLVVVLERLTDHTALDRLVVELLRPHLRVEVSAVEIAERLDNVLDGHARSRLRRRR